MLIGLRELLAERRAAGAAAGAFTCYNGETAIGVLRAAEASNAPVILLISEASLRSAGGELLLAMLLGAADCASVPACVQLDHAQDPKLIGAALEVGVSAVLADGSRLPYEENVAFVSDIARAAAATGADVEAELGRVEGNEDISSETVAGMLTDPEQALLFARETGATCLAVSIGNVHGISSQPAALDWDRLARIRTLVETPLSLHGASGLPDADVRRAVSLGVCKVNVNTEVRRGFLAELDRTLPRILVSERLLELGEVLVASVAEIVASKLVLLAGPDGIEGSL